MSQRQEQPHRHVVSGEHDREPVTLAEALEAASVTVGDQPVEWGDVAAIQTAEARAAGRPEDSAPLPGGGAEGARSAAEANAHSRTRYEDKIKLGEILMDAATELLPQDKVVTPEDAKNVAEAESRCNPTMQPYGGGVAATVAAAARINRNRNTSD